MQEAERALRPSFLPAALLGYVLPGTFSPATGRQPTLPAHVQPDLGVRCDQYDVPWSWAWGISLCINGFHNVDCLGVH